MPFPASVSVFYRQQHFKEHFITEICIHVIHRNKSRTSISATETEVSVEVQDSPVAYEVSTEYPSAEVRTSEDSSLKSDANTGKRNDAPNNPEKSGLGRRDSLKSGSRKIIGRFIGRFLNNCCHLPMMKATKKEAIEEGNRGGCRKFGF